MQGYWEAIRILIRLRILHKCSGLSYCIYMRKNRVAHREGRTRSLQMPVFKSLTLYPIELGGQYN